MSEKKKHVLKKKLDQKQKETFSCNICQVYYFLIKNLVLYVFSVSDCEFLPEKWQ